MFGITFLILSGQLEVSNQFRIAIFAAEFFLMEQWELEFNWLHLRNTLKEKLNMENLPDLNVVLILVGIQELGFTPPEMTKEIKQDLMHIGVCSLLSQLGIYSLDSIDEEGWPHYIQTEKIAVQGEQAQENLLIECALKYFEKENLLTPVNRTN